MDLSTINFCLYMGKVQQTPEDLIQYLFTLPSVVCVNEVEFELKFFINHAGYDGRLAYVPLYPEKIPDDWRHPVDGQRRTFLWLLENISEESDFRDAITETRQFLSSIHIDLLKPSDWAE